MQCARIISIGISAHLGLGHDELHVGREQQLTLGAAEPAERLDVLAVVHLSRNGGTAASNLHIGIWSWPSGDTRMMDISQSKPYGWGH